MPMVSPPSPRRSCSWPRKRPSCRACATGPSAHWNGLLALTREAKELNRVNGMLVNKQLAHTQGMLNTLRPAGHGAAGVYGPGGQAMPSGPSKRYLVG
jgi:flagellar biosynthesis/type III secretory pathway chaperone